MNDNYYHECSDNCETCETTPSNCLKCKNISNESKDNNCCPNYFYIDETKYYNCLKKNENCSGNRRSCIL